MVVPASDSQLAGAGVEPVANGSMLSVPTDGMPMVGDGVVPSDQGSQPPTVAPEAQAPLVDLNALQPEVRQYLEQQLRTGYIPSTDLDNLRSIKDKELADQAQLLSQLRLNADTSAAQVQGAMEAFSTYLQQVLKGERQPHENDLATFQMALQQKGTQVRMSRQQAYQEYTTWKDSQDANFEAELHSVAQANPQVGIPAITDLTPLKTDAEIVRLRAELDRIGKADAAAGFRNPQIQAQGHAITAQLKRRITDVAQGIRIRQLAAPMAAQHQQVQASLERQQARGVQTQSLPAALTAGPQDDDAIWGSVVAQFAANTGQSPAQAEIDHYQDIYREYMTRVRAVRAGQP